MKQNKIISLGAVLVSLTAIIGLAAVSMAAADNQNADSFKQPPASCGQHRQNFNRPELTEVQKKEIDAKRQAIEDALANNDYQAWVQAVGSDCPLLEKITADNFSRLVEAYQLKQQAGDLMGQARQIREQLGLKGLQSGKGEFRGFGKGLKAPLQD